MSPFQFKSRNKRSFVALTFRHFALPLACAIAAITAASAGRVGAAAPQGSASGIAPEALAQIEALIREKDTRSPVQQKIDSQLLYELRMKQGVPVANGIQRVETDFMINKGIYVPNTLNLSCSSLEPRSGSRDRVPVT